jgi:hypothetical protein
MALHYGGYRQFCVKQADMSWPNARRMWHIDLPQRHGDFAVDQLLQLSQIGNPEYQSANWTPRA